jgi:hypothetical protein
LVVTANNNDGEDYFGYGDSIMRADTCSGDPNSCFVVKMVNTYDPTASKDHNTDGGSRTSSWGDTNKASNYNTNNEYFIFMFGANDDNPIYSGSMTRQDHCENMMDIYNYTSSNKNGNSISIPCITPLKQNDTGGKPWNNYPDMTARMNALMNWCEKYSVEYCKMFDAIDSIPYNGRIDYFDGTYCCDHVHPTDTGHQKMSVYMWKFINGDFYDSTYHSSNDTYVVNCSYNMTIYIDKKPAWGWGDISVHCTTNDTDISFVQGYNDVIQFAGLNGSSYEINADYTPAQGTPPIITKLNNKLNNTASVTNETTLIWIVDDEALYYQIQVANDTSFTNPFINFTDVNESNYPAEYSQNATHVTFQFPDGYEIDFKATHCYRVRAYTLIGG